MNKKAMMKFLLAVSLAFAGGAGLGVGGCAGAWVGLASVGILRPVNSEAALPIPQGYDEMEGMAQ